MLVLDGASVDLEELLNHGDMRNNSQISIDEKNIENAVSGKQSRMQRPGSAKPISKLGKFEAGEDTVLMPPASRPALNSKVLETWLNETLADAEHLNIPGVILKPEHKNPVSRYGIDRLTLTNAGVPNPTVDRVFRCLFVYSVGFYELIKKLISHCNRKYTIITSIWKVF